MGLASSDIINIIGICVNAVLTLGLFLIVKFYINRTKGAKLSIFDYMEDKIRSEYTERIRSIDRHLLPKPEWFIDIPFEVMNDGDTTSKFTFHAILEFLDIVDKDGNNVKIRTRWDFVEILKPNEWDKGRRNFSFNFVTDIEHFKWIEANISIVGSYYNHKNKKQPIKIKPRKITNPNPIKKLSPEDQEKINNYNKEQQELIKKKK